MKIDLQDFNFEQFNVRDCVVGGEECLLIFPKHNGITWTNDNLIFRSSIWTKEGELISASFKKFFNWSEHPELTYTPFSLIANGGVQILEKIDGSTLVISMFKNELVVRTRGTASILAMKNGFELEILKKKYPLVFSNLSDNADTNGTTNFSLIFEWVSPNNIIVLNYGDEPDIYLTAKINHFDYSLDSQKSLDELARKLRVKRPKTFTFDSVKEMIATVENFKGQEGVCVYCNRGQNIRKLKSVEYLSLHAFKSNANFETVLDLYFELGEPNYVNFESKICEKFDYECLTMVKPFMSQVCDAAKKVKGIIEGMHKFTEPLLKLNRKEAAAAIFAAYGETNRAGFVFNIFDGKELSVDAKKKLFFQVTKVQSRR